MNAIDLQPEQEVKVIIGDNIVRLINSENRLLVVSNEYLTSYNTNNNQVCIEIQR